LALLIDWMQLMSLVGNISANWPDSLHLFYGIASFFSFEISVVSLRCFDSSWNFKWDMVVQFCLPLVIIAALTLGAIVKRLYRKQKNNEKTWNDSAADGNSIKRAATFVKFPRIALTCVQKQVMRAGSDLRCIANDKLVWYELWKRILNILEITYLVNTLYALSALRGISIGGETVVARAPVRIRCAKSQSSLLFIFYFFFFYNSSQNLRYPFEI